MVDWSVLPAAAALEPATRDRIDALIEDGHEHWVRFDSEVRSQHFHPFVPAEHEKVLRLLLELRRPGLRFLEWGSGMGVITIMADMLGFDASGIELDGDLVRTSRALAAAHGSAAQFAAGSFLPQGYVYRAPDGDTRQGTVGHGRSGYLELGRPLEDFDVVFGYPWGGEAPLMRDVMATYGSKRARLVLWAVDADTL
jgi:hypothetical protein